MVLSAVYLVSETVSFSLHFSLFDVRHAVPTPSVENQIPPGGTPSAPVAAPGGGFGLKASRIAS